MSAVLSLVGAVLVAVIAAFATVRAKRNPRTKPTGVSALASLGETVAKVGEAAAAMVGPLVERCEALADRVNTLEEEREHRIDQVANLQREHRHCTIRLARMERTLAAHGIEMEG